MSIEVVPRLIYDDIELYDATDILKEIERNTPCPLKFPQSSIMKWAEEIGALYCTVAELEQEEERLVDLAKHCNKSAIVYYEPSTHGC